jgi:hypothetical protein
VADVLPPALNMLAVLAALALLAESFGRDVRWLWRRRRLVVPEQVPSSEPVPVLATVAPAPEAGPGPSRSPRPTRAGRRGLALVASVLAAALVWFALLAPTRPDLLTPGAFARLPLEAVLLATLLLVLPVRWARPAAVVAGLALAGLVVLKALDLAMFSVLDRPFDLVTDRGQAQAGLAFVSDSLGPWAAAGIVGGVLLALTAVLACLVWAVRRLTAVATRHPRSSRWVVAVVALVWALASVTGLRLAPAEPLAARDAGVFVAERVRATASAYRARQGFDREVATDPFADAGTRDLAALKGNDVLLVFVESYGRVALEGQESAPVRALLDAGSDRLRSLGWSARSSYLTSPTFGSNSWLAHSTMQSGLSITDQSRYDRLLSSRRTTLTSAFADAGWRTVGLLPSTHGTWPEGREFYRFDKVYGRDGLGYAGPKFGFSAMPDQFALEAFARRELTPGRRDRVMAEVELTSSHGPWAPLPTMLAPAALGDGSVYDGMEAGAVTAAALWSDRTQVPAAYRTSIEYSLTSLLSFVEEHADDDLVLVMLGDHQPSTVVSGFGGNRDVPVTVLGRDPAVVDRIAGWGWQEGLRPDAGATVAPMAAFRDRFLTAFSDGAPVVSAEGHR